MAGGGGILISLEGNIEDRDAWGLGRKTNNQAEFMVCFSDYPWLKKNGIRKIQVLGDSMLIIKHMNYNSSANNMNLNQIIKRSQGMIPFFDLVLFFHILRGNNQEADKQENLAYQLNAERSIMNEVEEMTCIP